MPVEQTAEITHSAYELAWQEFINSPVCQS
jgi:hypothetical protein